MNIAQCLFRSTETGYSGNASAFNLNAMLAGTVFKPLSRAPVLSKSNGIKLIESWASNYAEPTQDRADVVAGGLESFPVFPKHRRVSSISSDERRLHIRHKSMVRNVSCKLINTDDQSLEDGVEQGIRKLLPFGMDNLRSTLVSNLEFLQQHADHRDHANTLR